MKQDNVFPMWDSRSPYVLVHINFYISEKVAVDFAHQNSGKKPFVRIISSGIFEHGATSILRYYVANVQRLFHMPTADEYKKTLEELKKDWGVAFEEYYMQVIHCDVHRVAIIIYRWDHNIMASGLLA